MCLRKFFLDHQTFWLTIRREKLIYHYILSWSKTSLLGLWLKKWNHVIPNDKDLRILICKLVVSFYIGRKNNIWTRFIFQFRITVSWKKLPHFISKKQEVDTYFYFVFIHVMQLSLHAHSLKEWNYWVWCNFNKLGTKRHIINLNHVQSFYTPYFYESYSWVSISMWCPFTISYRFEKLGETLTKV